MHLSYVMFRMARKQIRSYEFKDSNVRKVLKTLLRVFAVKELAADTAGLYERGFFTVGSGRLLDDSFKSILKDLRPHMIPLAEFSAATTTHIASVIGNEYGDIYET